MSLQNLKRFCKKGCSDGPETKRPREKGCSDGPEPKIPREEGCSDGPEPKIPRKKGCSDGPETKRLCNDDETVPDSLLKKLCTTDSSFGKLEFIRIFRDRYFKHETLAWCAQHIIDLVKGELANMYIYVSVCEINQNNHLVPIFIKLMTTYMIYIIMHSPITKIRCIFKDDEIMVNLTGLKPNGNNLVFFAEGFQLNLVNKNGFIQYQATLCKNMKLNIDDNKTFKLVISNDISNPPIFRPIVLGNGSYGVAILIMGTNGKLYVIKRFDKKKYAEIEWDFLSMVAGKHGCLQNGLGIMTDQPGGYFNNFIVSEHQGETVLSEFKKNGTVISLQEILSMFLEMQGALDAIHKQGFIHGDIKPNNIILRLGLDRKKMIMIDFGIAKRIGNNPRDSDSIYTWQFRFIGLFLNNIMMKEFNTLASTIIHPMELFYGMDWWAFFITMVKTFSQRSCDFLGFETEDGARKKIYETSRVIRLMKKLKPYLSDKCGMSFVQKVYDVLFKEKGPDEFIQVFKSFEIELEPSSGEAIYADYLSMFKKWSEENPMGKWVLKAFEHMLNGDDKVDVLIKELCDLFVEIICDGADFSLLGLFTKSRIDDWLLRLSQIQRKISELNADVFFY